MEALFRLPGAVRHAPAIDAWLSQEREELRVLVAPWLAHARRCGDDVRELMHDGFPTFCVGDAAFAYVAAFRDHANVGFFYGAFLPDPSRLLEGGGKCMRHVKLWPGESVDAAALGRLVDAAYAHVRARLAR